MKQHITFKKFIIYTITLVYFILLLKTGKIQFNTIPYAELLHRNSRTLASAMQHSLRGDFVTQRSTCFRTEKERKQKALNLIKNENNAEGYFNNLNFNLEYTEELNEQITSLDPKTSIQELTNIFNDLNENRRKNFHYLIEALENVSLILAHQNDIPEKHRKSTWCKIKHDLQCDFIKEHPNIHSNFDVFIRKIQSIDEFISYIKECIHSWNNFTNEKKLQYFPKVYETYQSDKICKENNYKKINNKTECNPKESIKNESIPKECIPNENMKKECVPNGCMKKQCVPKECMKKECVTNGHMKKQCVPNECMKKQCVPKECMKKECVPNGCMKKECTPNKNDKNVNRTDINNQNKTNEKLCDKKEKKRLPSK
ncbi:hypothetical protein PFMG_03795 [Plasmodium falciparum IGH-CR14]|uniref:Plasmodium RESA N-terminal domain-containing protein n=1 Tax=Plasmodium falciparum IGH-CR14 TaxID=580059 RepID=A0A0L1ID41_PLAFA|nr:hypothetical protein PFMG_03795 [Plasmodium falciparum IGH-CR14]